MKIVELLGKALKSDAILDLIEEHDLTVVYNVDIFREGTPDSFTVSAHALGFEMGFDEHQKAKVVWCYVLENDQFSRIDPSLIGVPTYRSIADVRSASEDLDCEFRFREKVDHFGEEIDWALLIHKGQKWHYEFGENGSRMITLSTGHA